MTKKQGGHSRHAMFEMAPAELPQRPSGVHHNAVSKGAVELSSEDWDMTLAELRGR